MKNNYSVPSHIIDYTRLDVRIHSAGTRVRRPMPRVVQVVVDPFTHSIVSWRFSNCHEKKTGGQL